MRGSHFFLFLKEPRFPPNAHYLSSESPIGHPVPRRNAEKQMEMSYSGHFQLQNNFCNKFQ